VRQARRTTPRCSDSKHRANGCARTCCRHLGPMRTRVRIRRCRARAPCGDGYFRRVDGWRGRRWRRSSRRPGRRRACGGRGKPGTARSCVSAASWNVTCGPGCAGIRGWPSALPPRWARHWCGCDRGVGEPHPRRRLLGHTGARARCCARSSSCSRNRGSRRRWPPPSRPGPNNVPRRTRRVERRRRPPSTRSRPRQGATRPS